MKTKTLFITLIVVALYSCKKDSPEPINNFNHTKWESVSPLGAVFTLDFISETECKWIVDMKLFTPPVYYFDYTFNGYRAELLNKGTKQVNTVCVINGSILTMGDRTDIFKRIN
jgi:hypothetical protein